MNLPINRPGNNEFIPSSVVIAGVTADNEFVVLKVKPDGTLDIALDFSGTVNVGEVSFSQVAGENVVAVGSSVLPAGAATQTTLAALLAKVIAAPSTEAKQDATNVLLTSLLAKVISAPATEVKQDTQITKLTSLEGKISTEITLAALNDKVTAVNTGAVVIASGAVTSTPVAASVAATTAYAASLVVKASAGTLYNLSGYNSGPAQWLQLHNSATLPANGNVPLLVLGIPAASTFSFDFALGIPCSTGIVISNSSAVATKTIASNDVFVTALYR